MVRSSDYVGDLADCMAPEPGQVIITQPVRRALENDNHDNTLFFVAISIMTPEQYAASSDDYVYNGHNISEWNELVDLSNEEYPYNEYNGDHGSNITIEQWKQAQEEAKTLDAEENRDASMARYQENVVPMLAEAQGKWESAEIERLSQLGYNVFMYGKRTTGAERIFAALLTKNQIVHFNANEDCGYLIDWVYDIDGVVDWEMRSQ